MSKKEEGAQEKKTVGKLAYDLLKKNEYQDHTAKDQTREQLEDYELNLWEAAQRGRRDFGDEFYVVVLTKKERLMPNLLRNYFIPRISCPTPNYDQIVYKYDHRSGDLIFLWVIPDRDTCYALKKNAHEVDPSEYELLRFVLDFADGTLFKISKRLNGEMEDSPLLAKGNI